MTDSDFNTPPWILDMVRHLAPIKGIGLDPCSNASSMVRATKTYTIETNGLAHMWRGNGLVFMNPPHSTSPNNIEPWMTKFRKEFIDLAPVSKASDQFVGLVPSKTGPEWFQETIPHVDARCFLKGRIKFWQGGVEQAGPGKFDSLLFYAGRHAEAFYEIFKDIGWCV